MKPLDKGLAFVLVALLASQVASQRGCELPDVIDVTPSAGEVWAVLIEETGDREPWLGQLIVQCQNADFGEHEFKSWDDDQLPDWANFPDVTERPVIVFVDAESKAKLGDARVTRETTPDKVREAINGYSG